MSAAAAALPGNATSPAASPTRRECDKLSQRDIDSDSVTGFKKNGSRLLYLSLSIHIPLNTVWGGEVPLGLLRRHSIEDPHALGYRVYRLR